MTWKSVNFDWNHIRAFLVTAEEGTLSAAAKALGLTQPTLSRQVSALETELCITLFERVGQRLVLTSSGLKLLEHARGMGDAALEFSLAVTGQSQKIEGSVIVSAGELTAAYMLPKIISKLRREEPGIDIEVVVTNEASDLKRREADIAIRSFHPTQNDLIAKKIGEEVIWLYGTPEYLDQLPTIPSFSELKDIQIIGFDRSNSLTDVLNKQGWQLSKKNFSLITSFQLLQLALCKEGQGVIFYPEQMGDQEPNLVRAYEHLGPVMKLPVWLVCHQELRTSLRVRRVFDFIATELSDNFY
ncbi:LysR family transcriptional regulator [Colwellia psychrerythraea]|uniref:Transcription regulator, LysR family n=1 Tax=Colwellia psychrerythraea (strain 34H / ATCC BAA-681) TaxID=167879 RepID=Q488G8_COLP3|nr:LysR family transcriptional regulator [Colwellia psychrerythraea]AAZ28296.1 transcription regulator, LysR family [Colwellia psychrerythraea 34H]